MNPSAWGFSDIRLKESIQKIGEDPRGFGIYEYNFRNNPSIRCRGVIAQELAEVMPEAVALHKTGYLMVDYGQIGGL